MNDVMCHVIISWLLPMNASSKVAVAGPPLSDIDLNRIRNEVCFFVHFSLVYMFFAWTCLFVLVRIRNKCICIAH